MSFWKGLAIFGFGLVTGAVLVGLSACKEIDAIEEENQEKMKAVLKMQDAVLEVLKNPIVDGEGKVV